MSKFIKLSSFIINSSKINYIGIKPKLFIIEWTKNDLGGFFFVGSGSISTTNLKMEICAENNPEDYLIMSEWINKLDH